jgi:hypothetical protein
LVFVANPPHNHDWLRKLIESQRAMAKAIEPSRKIQEAAAKLSTHHIARLNEQLQSSNSRTAQTLGQRLAAIEGPRQVLQQHYAQLSKLLESYDVATGLREAQEPGRRFERLWRQSLPANWRSLDTGEVGQLIQLTRVEGVPLVWVPGEELTRQISEKKTREETLSFLVNRSDRVLDDVEAILREVTSGELAGWAGKTVKAAEAYREGHTDAAQALAAAVVTAGLERALGFKKLERVRKTADKYAPDKVKLALYRTTLVIHLGSRCIQGYGYEKAGFNRGASLHEVSGEQYTPENSLAAIMLAAGILREAQEVRVAR